MPQTTTLEEMSELRVKLARAEARVRELEAAPAAPKPFLAQQSAFVTARPGAISISPTGLVSIMPFDGAKKRRRGLIAVVTGILLVVATIVGVMITSRAMH